jgi:hypothetical protein
MLNQMWLIWSDEHGAWWMSGKSGYTRDLQRAGRYSLEEATEICENANRQSDRIQETMFPCPSQANAHA